MESVIVHPNEITEEDQKRRMFMNNSSIHSYNNTSKKDRIIRISNGLVFRNGIVRRASLLLPQIEKGDLWIQNGKILDSQDFFYSRKHDNVADEVIANEIYFMQVIDASNYIISPGFIDIQINGAYGIDFSDPNVTMEEVHRVTRNLLSVFL